MIKEELTFHIAPNGPFTSFEDRDAFSQKFCHSLGLKVFSGCWSKIL